MEEYLNTDNDEIYLLELRMQTLEHQIEILNKRFKKLRDSMEAKNGS